MGNMWCGYASIVYSLRGEYEIAAPFIGLAYAPEFLGHTFAQQHRFSAAAATDVDMCMFPRASFNRLFNEFP